ncbi:hypothetical protein [Sphingosinicella sp. BN140058]|uniref:hypothetical protein n=1 Tax=Sphingosinicella sp. BN140058 TaxID=1892855 RepID=UPI0010133961|nr:hypothetical protein [Sphingosinicella sp. BN140058]QAY80395.1 hypothetical protein ETR14_27530 [Sphingosinicella sp. BN140058]
MMRTRRILLSIAATSAPFSSMAHLGGDQSDQAIIDQAARREFGLAHERWRCTSTASGEPDTETVQFGVFRTHIRDEVGHEHVIAQDDDNVLVASYSFRLPIGAGKWDQAVSTLIIDRKSGRFRSGGMTLSGAPLRETTGICVRNPN